MELTANQSVLSQLRDPGQYPEITYLGDVYKQLKLYRNWGTGPHSALRKPVAVDQPNDFLAEDASNIALVLNSLDLEGETRSSLIHLLGRCYDQFERYSTRVEMGTVQVFFHEKACFGQFLLRGSRMEPCDFYAWLPSFTTLLLRL